MPRCQSTCKKKEKTNCQKTRRCSYVEGSKRQYCRLSGKYKMTKKTCNVIPRYTPQTAAKRIQSFYRHRRRHASRASTPSNDYKTPPETSPKVSTPKIREFRKKNASRKIARFMKRYESQRRARFLNTVCSDSGVCIAFGKETEAIRKHFAGFTAFAYLDGAVQRIGKPSANGFVNMLTYSRDGYLSNAILKSSTKSTSDNLYYEYLVGKFLNKMGQLFPCFVETYGAFKYTSMKVYLKVKNNSASDSSNFYQWLEKIPEMHTPEELHTACVNPQFCAVLIQHLKNAESLYDFMDKNPRGFISADLAGVLLQVYMPLSTMSKHFTHYDLHGNNVLVYEPIHGGYIQYHYHLKSGETVSFKSRYIAKIIDYGRCFFRDSSEDSFTGSSKRIYHALCTAARCRSKCGYNEGFGWLEALRSTSDNYISSQIKNESHDLRLAKWVSSHKNVSREHPEIYALHEKIIYKEPFGTPEARNGWPGAIHTVHDMVSALTEILKTNTVHTENIKEYRGLQRIGEMHVYSDGTPLEFISHSPLHRRSVKSKEKED